jgi:Protein of unknown function (DUF4054)
MICAPGAIAVFVYSDFTTQYPAFATNPPQVTLQAYFDIAGELYLRNDGTGRVRTVAAQTALMYMLVAHMAQLAFGADGVSPSGLVGRIASATQGSVNVSTDYPSTPNNAWFLQTPAGASFWQATSAFRSVASYRPGPTRFGNGFGSRTGFQGNFGGRFPL